jgi:hypothetical protein
MASTPKYYDRVMETSTTTGTGTYTLAGAVTGHQSFAVVANGNSCYYVAMEVNSAGNPAGGWEVGIGTYTSAGTLLSRDTILASSNAGAAVNWAAGTRRVFLTVAAAAVPALLAYTQYNPGAVTDITTTATTGADVDAANLAVTFIVPPTGNILVSLTARCFQSAGNYYWWNLRTTGGTNVAGTRCMIDGNASSDGRRTHRFVLTGLTPGASQTYRWGFGVSAGTGHLLVGDPGGTTTPVAGPAIMEVWSAP